VPEIAAVWFETDLRRCKQLEYHRAHHTAHGQEFIVVISHGLALARVSTR
jgi:hypothetical protein